MMTKLILIIFTFNVCFSNLTIAGDGFSHNTQSGFSHQGGDGGLNDQDYQTSKEYIHEGLQKRTKEELCEAETPEDGNDPCSGRQDSDLFGMVLKAYGMIVGMLPGDSPLTSFEVTKDKPSGSDLNTEEGVTGGNTETGTTDTASTDASQNTEQETEKQNDYCRYVAVATEAIAMFKQQAAQQQIQQTQANDPNPNKDQQREQLYGAKRSHMERAENSEFQAWGWGATSVCYVAQMATFAATGGAGNWKNWVSWLIKQGLSVAATIWFAIKAADYREYAKKVQGILNKMPKAGDCNPITDRACYCTQPETKHDPKYCTPYLHQRALMASQTRVACVDKKMKADPKCGCLSSGGCFDVEYMQMIDGTTFTGESSELAKNAIRQMSRGQVNAGDLSTGTVSNSVIRKVKNNLKKLGKLPIDFSNMSKKDKKIAFNVSKLGVPKEIAAIAASARVKGAKKYADKVKSYYSKPSRRYSGNSKKKGRTLSFEGGDNWGNKSKSSSSSGFNINKLLNRKKRGRKTASKVKTLDFRDKASRKAQISRHKDRMIFDIISRRYKISGLRRLDVK